MLTDSFKHAKSDLEQRALIEAKNEAAEILRATGKALGRGRDLLEAQEIGAIEAAVADLAAAMEGTDRHAVRRKKEHLDAATRRLAEVLMDESLQEALRAKHVSQFLPEP